MWQILYRCGSTQWQTAALADIGPGWTAANAGHGVAGIGIPDETIEFVFNGVSNGVNENNAPRRHAKTKRNHRTLDAGAQDKQVFNYPPPDSLGAPRIEERVVNLTVAGIPARTVRIYRRRTYSEHDPSLSGPHYVRTRQSTAASPAQRPMERRLACHALTGQGRLRDGIIAGMDNNGPNRGLNIEPSPDLVLDQLRHRHRRPVPEVSRTRHV